MDKKKAKDLLQVRQSQLGKRTLMMDNVRVAKALQLKEEDKSDVEVVLQVKDIHHARSAEVLAFCLDHVGSGGTWSDLRRKLGLGFGDIRWKIIRERAVEGLLPINEDEAIKAVGAKRSYLIDKLEKMLHDLELRMESLPEMTKDGVYDHHFWKLRIEAMKLLLEENSKNLTDHLEMKKAKAADKMARGGSLIVQNNYYIPRPGDGEEKIRDVVPIINQISDATQEIEGLIANPERVQTD